MEIGMLDVNCIANISLKFDTFCRKNSGIIAQRMGPFLPDRLLLPCALERALKGGRDLGGTVADMGVCRAYLPSRAANLVFDRWGTQFGTAQIKICELHLAVLENNCKSACKRATLLQVTCLFDQCGTQFGTSQIKICDLYLAVLENNCKSACKRVT